MYSVSTDFRLIQYIRVITKLPNSEATQFSYIAPYRSTRLGNTSVFYTFYLVYIWHCRIKLFLRHLTNCPCSNFSRYVDLFQEISPRIAKQLSFWVKLHHIRRKCKNDNTGFFTNGLPAMKNPDALRIFFSEFFGGKYKRWKKITADGVFRKNGTTTIWIWKHWNNFMVKNC